MRVVSMLPSATEIVYALGMGDSLVGVTFECDEPARARIENAIIVGGRDTSAMAPGEIDAYVHSQLAAGKDLYTLDTGALASLAPEVILTQDLCRVCAVPSDDVEAALAYLGCAADVVSLEPTTLDAVLDSIITIGDRLGVLSSAHQLVAGLRTRLGAIATAVAKLPRPRVSVVEWVDPPFAAGHWVPDLVTAAGGTPVGARPGDRSVETTWAAIACDQPDLILVAPCGFHLEEALDQARSAADNLPDVPIWAIDADGLVVRPGPRLVEGVEAIAAILHPGAVPPAPAGAIARV